MQTARVRGESADILAGAVKAFLIFSDGQALENFVRWRLSARLMIVLRTI